METLSASSPSTSGSPDNGGLACPVHRALAGGNARRTDIPTRVVRSATPGAAIQARAAYAAALNGLVYPNAVRVAANMHAWLPMVAFKSVVLCRRPPNPALKRTHRQRHCLRVSLVQCLHARSVARSVRRLALRSASSPGACGRRVADMHAIVADPVAADVADGPVVLRS